MYPQNREGSSRLAHLHLLCQFHLTSEACKVLHAHHVNWCISASCSPCPHLSFVTEFLFGSPLTWRSSSLRRRWPLTMHSSSGGSHTGFLGVPAFTQGTSGNCSLRSPKRCRQKHARGGHRALLALVMQDTQSVVRNRFTTGSWQRLRMRRRASAHMLHGALHQADMAGGLCMV